MKWRSSRSESPAGQTDKPTRQTTVRRSIAYLTGGGLISTVLYALGGLLIGRLVDPATLGLFNGIGLILTYAAIGQFGIFSGLSRELPYYIGKGDRPRAEELASVAQAWALMVGGVVFVALTGVSAWQLAQGDLWRAAGWFTNALLALQLFYTTYLQVTYRTAHDFARVALIRVVVQTALVLLLLLVIPLDFYGLCLRALLAGALNVALLVYWRPTRVGPRWNVSNFMHLLRIGLPIFIVGQVLAYWDVIDQTLVLKLGGVRMMGLYSMAIMVSSAVDTLPGAISQVFFPRMAEQFGRGYSVRELMGSIARPILVTTAAAIPLLVAAWFLIGPLTRILIPQYTDAVPAIQWALAGCFLTCFEPAINIFTVVRRQFLRLVGTLMGAAAYAGSLAWLIHDGVRLTAFPQAMLIGHFVYVVVCYFSIYYLMRRERETPRPAA